MAGISRTGGEAGSEGSNSRQEARRARLYTDWNAVTPEVLQDILDNFPADLSAWMNLCTVTQPTISSRDLEAARAAARTIVVSSDEVTGAGVWCGAALAWDMANRENSVDIAHAVRSIRISRPGLVTSLGEYAMTRELVTRLVHT